MLQPLSCRAIQTLGACTPSDIKLYSGLRSYLHANPL
jgi:hypothetical protein